MKQALMSITLLVISLSVVLSLLVGILVPA